MDKIYDLEALNDTLEKEKSLHQLEFSKIKEEVEKLQNERKSFEN